MPRSAWNYTGPYAPWCEFNINDPSASLNFTFDAVEWLAASGTGLTLDQAGSGMVVGDKLTVVATSFAGSKMTARIERSAVPAAVGDFVELTVKVKASDGQHDNRIYFLQLAERRG